MIESENFWEAEYHHSVSTKEFFLNYVQELEKTQNEGKKIE